MHACVQVCWFSIPLFVWINIINLCPLSPLPPPNVRVVRVCYVCSRDVLLVFQKWPFYNLPGGERRKETFPKWARVYLANDDDDGFSLWERDPLRRRPSPSPPAPTRILHFILRQYFSLIFLFRFRAAHCVPGRGRPFIFCWSHLPFSLWRWDEKEVRVARRTKFSPSFPELTVLLG